MSRSAELSEQARERMSRLVDGEGSPDELQQMMSQGRDSPQAWSETLQSWHAYHLIGDVMRSDELAGRGRDDVFLKQLRARLAEEPVVLAPPASEEEAEPTLPRQQGAVTGGQGRRRRVWRTPMAAAAGVMMVAGVAVMSGLPGRQGGRLQDATTLVQASAPATTGMPGTAISVQMRTVGANAPLLRDARLDPYLLAHKQFGGSSALGVPSGFLRSATYDGPNR